MTADLHEEEKWAARREAELAAAPDGMGWGEVIFRGKLIDVYHDPDFINYTLTQPIKKHLPPDEICMIADFGGGNGWAAQTVCSQLERPDDCPVLMTGIDHYKKALQKMREIAPNVRPVQNDLLALRFAPNTFHAGIFRFALPFIRRELQPKVFKEIHRVLKPGAALVVLNYGVLKGKKLAEAYDTLFNEGDAASGQWTVEQIKADMHIPSFKRMKVMAKEAGFEINSKSVSDLTDTALGYLSPEIYANRNKLSDAQRKGLETVYEKWKQKDVLPFEPNSLRVLRPMYTCVLEKPSL